MTSELRKKIWNFCREWVAPFLLIALVVTSFRSAIADWNDVPTGSMKPTILEGDRIFVNKLAYDLKIPFTTWHVTEWSAPARGDIVVFFSPEDGKRLVKRVIALPGDIVELRDNMLYLNNLPLNYEPLEKETIDQVEPDLQSRCQFFCENLIGIKHPVMIDPSRPAMRSFGPAEAPDNCYFMMGDNRDNSADSRYFGFVERRRIVGRASRVALSVDRNDYYLPRWDRFLRKLP
ncbi:MAG: signal peptidase I [Candidatus Omnitrophota bacterium]